MVGFQGSIKRVFSDTSITVLLIVTLFFALPIGTFNTLFPIHATSSLGFTASTVSILFAVRGGFNVLVREPSGVLSDHVGRKKILTVVFIFAMISFIILAFSSDLYMIAAAMTVFGIAWGIRPPVLSAAIGDRLPIDLIPLAMAMYYTSISTGFMVGSLMAGFMGGRYPWHIIMVPYILLAAASAVLIVKIFKEKGSENSNLKTNKRMNR